MEDFITAVIAEGFMTIFLFEVTLAIKSRETREVSFHTCRYSSGHFIPSNSVILKWTELGIKLPLPQIVTCAVVEKGMENKGEQRLPLVEP